MTRHDHRPVLALAVALAAGPAVAQGTIKDYLFTHNAGPVAANDIIGISKSVISDLQTPRDLALSIGNFGDREMVNGFGISFTPARSGFDGLAIAVDKYRQGDWPRRIWGGTTFSYAQNRKKISNADYDQSAFAISTTFLIDRKEDPIIVAYDALAISEGEGVRCRVQQTALEAADKKAEEEQRRLAEEFPQRNGGRFPNKLELADIEKQTKAQREAEVKALADLRTCAHKVAADIEKKWNASRFQLLLGRGWIKPTAGGGDRLRLGSHAKVSLALGAGEYGLANFTWRRAGDELDLTTLGSTPAFKNTKSAAIRYTYKAGKKGDTFAIAEVSNVKASTTTASQGDFKQAVGFDRLVAPGLWIEFRYGRASTTFGTGLENKALFALKFSEDTSLEKQIK